MDALILCGGRATRLGGSTASVPKALVEVAGRPFLDYLLELYRPHCERLFLLAGHLAEQLEPYAQRGCRVVVERERLDTGGAVLNAIHELDSRFLVANGDTYFEGLDLPAIFARAAERPAHLVTVNGERSAGGGIELQGEQVVGFQEKGQAGPGLLYAGLSIFDRCALESFAGGPISLEREIFPQLTQNGSLSASVWDLTMFDIGTPERLEHFRRYVRSKETN